MVVFLLYVDTAEFLNNFKQRKYNVNNFKNYFKGTDRKDNEISA